ncbi:nucleoside hydrolase [Anaerolentibacter hominis]|uniref:nucleoside hydrolase n=1 Tax=Anaerolentibacter hominis TaxID=3079009 RepID=UPI0031B86880
MDKRKIIFDCDPGTDDAVAMLVMLNSPEFEILGITTVNGNRAVELTTENALRVVEYVGSDVPVFKGCYLPMVATIHPERRAEFPRYHKVDMHGDYLNLPAATIKPQPQHAVSWIIDTLLKSEEKITLVTVGPLTNIGMALRLAPEIAQKVDEVLIMGGAYAAANRTPSAEFNIWGDPEAAQIVMQSPMKKILFPLDATWRACIRPADIEEMKEIGTPPALAAADMISLRIQAYEAQDVSEDNKKLRETPGSVCSQVLYQMGPSAAAVHDALPVVYMIDPEVITEMPAAEINVEIAEGLCDGRTVIDFHNCAEEKGQISQVAMNADEAKFASIIKERLNYTKALQ